MQKKETHNSGEEKYLRFKWNIRIQHIVLMISTIMLIISGLPLKFYTTGWAKFTMGLLGGTEGARKIHHLAALVLIGVGIFHLGYIIFSRTGRNDFKLLIPVKKDFTDFGMQMKYFFNRSREKPRFGRFSYIEKFDYWAVYWGFVIMIGSGIIMWMFQGKFNPLGFGQIDISFASGIVDNYVHAISREAHSDEALLATLAIIVWHFYNVHFNPDKFPGNKVWITGTMTKEEMEKEHPLELEEIENRTANAKSEVNESDSDALISKKTETAEVTAEKEEVNHPSMSDEDNNDGINEPGETTDRIDPDIDPGNDPDNKKDT